MCAYVCLGGAGLMVGVLVGRMLDWWVWRLVVAEWGWVWQSLAHSASEVSQLVAVAFELPESKFSSLEIRLPQAMPFPASTQRVSQPLRFVGHVPVNVGTGNLGLDQNQIDSKRFPKHTLLYFEKEPL